MLAVFAYIQLLILLSCHVTYAVFVHYAGSSVHGSPPPLPIGPGNPGDSAGGVENFPTPPPYSSIQSPAANTATVPDEEDEDDTSFSDSRPLMS